MISAEGARNHGLLNVPTDEFFDTKHYIPMDLAEQRKIADFMIALEHRIEAQQSLVDNLKKHKRGLLNAFFAEKSDYFLFSDASALKIEEVCDVLSGKRIPKGETILLSSYGIPLHHCIRYGEKYVCSDNLQYISRAYRKADFSL